MADSTCEITTPERRGIGNPYKSIRVPTIRLEMAGTLFKPKRTDCLILLKWSIYSLVLSLSTI